ncbi:MAG: ABC transporter substrate-binding protein, partial [Dehalococcoidia bacterium]|nr:ABC transporter substrate-binding protein [Dehalococcoidia bacterium]
MDSDKKNKDEILYRGLDRRSFLKLAGALGGAAALGLPLLGCQPTAAPAPASTQAPSSAPTAVPKTPVTLKVAAPELGLFQDSPLDMAITLGLFEQEGITLDWVEFKGGSDQVRAVTTGGFDLGIVSPAAPITAFAQGEPARLICGGWLAIGTTWLVKADSPLKTLKDLKGKKVGYSRPGSNSQIVTLLA